MSITVVSPAACLLHDPGAGHPESIARLEAILAGLEHHPHWHIQREVASATYEQLIRAHDPRYTQALLDLNIDAGRWLNMDSGDTRLMHQSVTAALQASGAALWAADQLMANPGQHYFCAIRPPGHHAEIARGMGFCVFNNVMVAASHLLTNHDLERIAIVDFDVHHGNGTEEMSANNSRLLYCSSFQHPYFPYSGYPASAENIISVPLPFASDGTYMREHYERHIWPAVEEFSPDMILVSAGFDAHRNDPLGGLQWRDEDYHWLGQKLGVIASKLKHPGTLSVLEGGYDIATLPLSVAAYLQGLESV